MFVHTYLRKLVPGRSHFLVACCPGHCVFTLIQNVFEAAYHPAIPPTHCVHCLQTFKLQHPVPFTLDLSSWLHLPLNPDLNWITLYNKTLASRFLSVNSGALLLHTTSIHCRGLTQDPGITSTSEQLCF